MQKVDRASQDRPCLEVASVEKDFCEFWRADYGLRRILGMADAEESTVLEDIMTYKN